MPKRPTERKTERSARRRTRRITCPRCGRVVRYADVSDVPSFPFCSDRCRLVDLDKWFEGEYRISEDISGADGGKRPGGAEKP